MSSSVSNQKWIGKGAIKMQGKEGKKLKKLISLAMESMGVAITIIDTNGTLLYYNKQAAKILDRKPEYIGKDVHSHHKKATSNKKVDLMLQDFQKGRTEPFHYEAKPYGKTILVTLSPILEDGKFIGCTQSVQLKEDTESK
jgi:PAS domain S-box-containing protein